MTFCAVPVLPASTYPGTSTSGAVPNGPSTPSSIVRSSAEVLSLITRVPSGSSTGSPSTDSISRGGRRVPPLAMAAYPSIICIGVTERPWPMGRLPIEEPE